DLHAHDLGALADALDVLADLKEVQLALVSVPVAAHTLEDRGPVVEGVGHDVDVRLLQRDELAFEERGWCCHRCASPCPGGPGRFLPECASHYRSGPTL